MNAAALPLTHSLTPSLTFTRSTGCTKHEAVMAAVPPHTKGSRDLASEGGAGESMMRVCELVSDEVSEWLSARELVGQLLILINKCSVVM